MTDSLDNQIHHHLKLRWRSAYFDVCICSVEYTCICGHNFNLTSRNTFVQVPSSTSAPPAPVAPVNVAAIVVPIIIVLLLIAVVVIVVVAIVLVMR